MPKRKETLGTLFQDIARLRIFCFNSMLKDLELTATQAWVLSALMEKEGIIQGDLAETLGIRAVTLGGLVDRMESKNWIERRPDEKDRRAKRIWLTPSGRKLEKLINKCLDAVHDIAIGELSRENVDHLHDTITTIRANLRQYKGQLDNS
jgi:MarR family transcriptional regulator, transcriptional regulator for hemolysin